MGKKDRKINRRNLSRDREISLTMRALVRAKWSERGGRMRSWGEKEAERSGKQEKRMCIFGQNMHVQTQPSPLPLKKRFK